MSRIFWLSFGMGSIYSLRKEQKKPLSWGLPTAFMGTVAVLATFKLLGDEKGIVHPQDLRNLPKTFVGASIGTGTMFCLGHLLTKMAYPVFHDEN
jgi:hypothetical protein